MAPLAKTPLLKGQNWREIATTDAAVIYGWNRDSPNANYGIACGDKADLFVIDIDTAEAGEWWDAQGFEAGATVTTPSGGRHIYYRVEGVEVQTNQSAIHSGIDIRGSGGYVVGPGCTLPNGSYAGDISEIPMAPDALLAIIPEKQTYVAVERTGEKSEAATDAELRQITDQVKRLEVLPRVWSDGAAWRSTFYRAACHFWRMIQSPDYALTEGAAWSILMTATPTDSEWGEPEAHAQWLSAQKSTAGQFADVPDSLRPQLLPILDVSNLLPATTSTGRPFTDLLFNTPDLKTTGAAWDRRKSLMVEALKAGMDDAQTATLGWNSASAELLRNDPNGLTKLWREVDVAKTEVARSSGASIEAIPNAERTTAFHKQTRIDLLTKKERAYLAGDTGHWWGSRYLDWARAEVKVFNGPYHRASLWAVLSVVFSPYGYVPTSGRPTECNLFQLTLGDTTTGKSEALALEKLVIKAFFPNDDQPFVGPKVSENGLILRLVQRDGKPSLLINDEASGLFTTLRDAQWAGGLAEFFTQLYDNDVPSIEMATHKEASGVHATTFFGFHLTGVFSKVAAVLTTEEWESGLLPRFLISIGDHVEVDPEVFKLKLRDGSAGKGYDQMPKQWAAEFHTAINDLKLGGVFPVGLGMEAGAIAVHDRMTLALNTMFVGHPLAVSIKPSAIRLGVNVLKCAALVAMSEGAITIDERHMLIAVEQAEEWITNAVTLAHATSATAFTRQVDDIERFVASTGKGEVLVERIYRHSPRPKYETDRLVDQLVAEGRVTRIRNNVSGAETIATKREGIAA